LKWSKPEEIIVTPEGERKLFTPVQIGAIALEHRVVMAPLTRSRSVQPGDILGDLMREYYEQRASDGGLVISEATTISITARGWFGAPGIYSDEQVGGWKKIVHAVHAKGGRMFSQLWHMGRPSHVDMTNGAVPVAPSVVPRYWGPDSTAVASIAEIPGIVEGYRKAAERAKSAGFDGVEVHAANGYLLDQFCRTAATNAPTRTAARSKTAPVSCRK
jgi:N-ethylmaleimide reductase